MTVLHEEGAIVKVGSALVDIKVEADPQGGKVSNNPVPALFGGSAPAAPTTGGSSSFSRNSSIPQRNDGRVLTTPAVRKLAKENNLDLSAVAATGPKGRVVKEDVLAHLSNGALTQSAKSTFVSKAPQQPLAQQHLPSSMPSSSSSSSSPPSSSPSSSSLSSQKHAADKVVPIRGVQRLMVKSMTAALQVQHLTYSDELIVDQLLGIRDDLKAEGKKIGVKVSIMPLIIKATSLALLQFPMLNATVNNDCSEMTYHSSHNIGIAMDTANGLVVPVIRSVQNKSIFEIARELNALQEAALDGRLVEQQLSGGTFTLSNIGSIGGTYAVPVLLVPQVAIAAIGKQRIVPRYFDKEGRSPAQRSDIFGGAAVVKPTTIMNVSWSADHRVVDGATVAKFSNVWKVFLERPSTMLGNLN